MLPSYPHHDDIEDLVQRLSKDSREPVVSEIRAIQSIFGDDTVTAFRPGDSHNVRYEVALSLPSPHDDVSFKVLVSIPSTYPETSPPQMQLLSKYIGSFGVPTHLFAAVLRTFISVQGVEWIPDMVCVFDGLQHILDICASWYEGRLSDEKSLPTNTKETLELSTVVPTTPPSNVPQSLQAPPFDIKIFEAEPITDRKSAFVGRACAISHPDNVPLVLSYLMSDKRISRAAHPVIHAWRCQVGSVLHQDNDDDGETAGGGRLAHLLQILEVNNVLVVVTRYFGGIHLGPDRFKHINQAARNALEAGGFLDAVDEKSSNGRGKRH